MTDSTEVANPSAHAADAARQEQIPLALIRGEPVLEVPRDLYIPPDALAVILDAFEGPLDLLLYLIRKHRIDIYDIPIALITTSTCATSSTCRTWTSTWPATSW